MLLFHSVSGRDDDYHETLYNIPKKTIASFIDDYYMDFAYPNVKDCSNAPKFHGKFVGPFPRGIYILRSCKLTGDGFPYFLPIGYYKIQLRICSQVEINIVGVSKVTPRVV